MSRITLARKILEEKNSFPAFNKLDGTHPWMEQVPDGCVLYRTRVLPQGRPVYFNFFLAKEMGLIDATCPHVMTPELEEILIDTFSLQIINEYDELTQRKINPHLVKPNKYMATRYLQLQHANKQGKTSGDGRGIWNGTIQHKGQTWDVSSRGTGVTCLAPGAVQANKPLKTGTTDYGYGCGQAEIDELYGAAILAEIMHLQGIPTERVLCIIDLGRGVGIGVRAATNLLRPAHMFLYLKQNRHEVLKASVDYFLQRQIKNKAWDFKPSENPYDQMLHFISKDFADFTAKLDIDYIFAWLDWDGDNVLANAGIIDYGSVRQFGIRHDQYRYDDVERFSTNLNEQRHKAKQIVQVFCQMADFVKSGKKKAMKEFANHKAVLDFTESFANKRADRLLYKMGLTAQQREFILKNHRSSFEQFNKIYTYFESAKVSGAEQKVPDGVNHPALYNMRQILKVLPQIYLKQSGNFSEAYIDEKEFYKNILSGFAKSKDAKIRDKHIRQIQEFQKQYKKMVTLAADKSEIKSVLKNMSERSQKLNSETRITGNSLIRIVNALVQEQKKGLRPEQIQKTIDKLVLASVGLPEVKISRFYRQLIEKPVVRFDLYQKLQNILIEHCEDI